MARTYPEAGDGWKKGVTYDVYYDGKHKFSITNCGRPRDEYHTNLENTYGVTVTIEERIERDCCEAATSGAEKAAGSCGCQ